MTTENLPQIQNNNFPSQVDLQSVALIARTAHASNMYNGVGGEAKIMMILLAAKELGVGPCQALNGGIWSIQGKIEISARLMNGLIRRAGHSITLVRSDDECCTLKGTRTDGDSIELSFTKEDAIKAGLWGTNTWKKYPGDMLYNRCMSRLARRLFSDVIGQCYIEGELREAKEVEKKERELEQAECEEIKPIALSQISQHDTNMDHLEPTTNLTEEPKISADELTTFLTHYVNTDDNFKENFEKYMMTEWSISDFKDILAKRFNTCMTAITRNIEMKGMVK